MRELGIPETNRFGLLFLFTFLPSVTTVILSALLLLVVVAVAFIFALIVAI